MKNINKIMFACMMMTVGSLSAMGGKPMGSNSATWSPTKNFIVDKGIPGYVAGMAGNYNPKSDPTKACVNDVNGNVVFTYSPVIAHSQFQKAPEESYILIGSYEIPAPAEKPCPTGAACPVAAQGPSHMNLYGLLTTNS